MVFGEYNGCWRWSAESKNGGLLLELSSPSRPTPLLLPQRAGIVGQHDGHNRGRLKTSHSPTAASDARVIHLQ